MNPVRILASDTHVRAVRGGLGAAKTMANYAASLYGAEEAQKAIEGMNGKDMDGRALTVNVARPREERAPGGGGGGGRREFGGGSGGGGRRERY